MATETDKGFPSLNALRVFEAVSRAGSFKAAAASLNVTQSAVSRQMTTLEKQLGVRLIQRDNRMHALTPAGQALAPELTKVFNTLQNVVDKARREGKNARRHMNLGISTELMRWWVGPKLESFRQLYPYIELHCSETDEYLNSQNEQDIVDRLHRGELDAVVVFGDSTSRSLAVHKLSRPTLRLVQSANVSQYTDGSEPERFVYSAQSDDWQRWNRQRPSPAPSEHMKSVASTAMAIEIVRYSRKMTLVPALYLQSDQLKELKPVSDYAIESHYPLSLLVRKGAEKELATVALVNWFKHQASLL